MKKNKWLLCAAASVLMLGACAQPGSGTDNGDDIHADLTGTVSFTFKSDYEITVNPLKGKETFEHDVTDTVTANLDLTAGQLYAHVKREGKDHCVAKQGDAEKTDVLSSKEALVYQDGADYYYLTKTMGDPVKLASEAAALAKIDQLLISTSALQSGDVSLSTLGYEGNYDYEWKQITLAADALNDDPEDPVYRTIFEQTKTDTSTGFTVTGSSKYVGLKGDTGAAMDYSGDPAVTYTIDVNKDNYVTKLEENIDSSLVMHLSEKDNPTVNYKGTRKLAATYGGNITKLDTITHEQAYGTINYLPTPYGEVELFNVETKGATVTAANKLVPDATGKIKAKVATWLAIKVTTPNKINSVNNSGASTLKPEGGYYWLEVVEDANDVSVAYGEKQLSPNCPTATIALTLGEGVEYAKDEDGKTLAPYFYHWKKPNDRTALFGAEHNIAPAYPGYFIAYPLAAPADTHEYKFTANGHEIEYKTMGGVYSVEFKEAGEYTLKIELVAKETETATHATFYVLADEGVTYTVKELTMPDFAHMVDVTAAGKIAIGKFLVLSAKAPEGKTIEKVTMNGTEVALGNEAPTYNYSVKNADHIVITIKLAGQAAPAERGTIKITAPEGVEYKVTQFIPGAPGSEITYEPTTNNQVTKGKWACITISTEGVYEVTSADGKVMVFPGPSYCINVTACQDYNVTIVKAAQLKVTAPEGVEFKVTKFVLTPPNIEYIELDPKSATAEVGKYWFGIFVTAVPEGKTLDKVTLTGGNTTPFADTAHGAVDGQVWCVNAKASTTYEVTITIK